MALSKVESKNMRELIARVLNAVCKHADLRGLVVQQGGTKVLASIALDGTEKGMRHAAQALARIGITQDPSIAFPGQRVRIRYILVNSLFLTGFFFKLRQWISCDQFVTSSIWNIQE